MAIKHYLQLDIPETACENILRIMDASVYGDGLGVDCQRLDITLPGFSQPIYVSEDITKGFVVNVSAKDLGLQVENDDPLCLLPDGLYTIKYSVSPNDSVYVEYYHLRTTHTVNLYYKQLCKLQLEMCEPDAETKQKLSDLRFIKSYIDAAKAKAEYCHSPKQSVAMLAYAESLLHKYVTGCCITCQ